MKNLVSLFAARTTTTAATVPATGRIIAATVNIAAAIAVTAMATGIRWVSSVSDSHQNA